MHELRNHFSFGSSVRSKQLLCFVQGQGQKTEQFHTTKNFDKFHNHSPQLTTVRGGIIEFIPVEGSQTLARHTC